MDCYQIVRIVGQGAFGNAYLAVHREECTQYIIKKIDLKNKTPQEKQNIFNEVRLLQEFKHINIVSYRDSFIDKEDCLNIVMQYCEGGDVSQIIEHSKGSKIDEKQILNWAVQIAFAIFYMHDKRILHRDLKTPNIFLSNGIVKLGDFGISKVLDESVDLASTSIGTPYYMSPEQYKYKPYSYKSDIWAFGCILYELCNQKRPFEAASVEGLARKVFECRFSAVSEYYSPQLRDLVKSMLSKNPKDRPSILEFLNRPVIRKRAQVYLKQAYDILLKSAHDKELLNSLLQQASKLKISLENQRVEPQTSEKKTKAEANVEKLKHQKEKAKQQLQELLQREYEQRKEKQLELRKLEQQKKALQRLGRKDSEKSFKTKKQGTTARKEERQESRSERVLPVQCEKKPFRMKEEYDMYDMHFEEESEGEKETETIKELVEEEEEKVERISGAVSKKNLTKEAQAHTAKENPTNQAKDNQGKDNQYNQFKDNQFNQAKDNQYNQPKDNQYNQAKYSLSRKELFVEATDKKPEDVEEKVLQIREELKEKNQKIYTIKNELSNIDFSISSSDEEHEPPTVVLKNDQVMKKKLRNPVYARLNEKINDLRAQAEQYSDKSMVDNILAFLQTHEVVSRSEIDKLAGGKIGVYHIANEIRKLTRVQARVPAFV